MSSVRQNIIKHKVVGLLNLAAELGNVSRACIEALIDANRRKPNSKNRVEEATEVAVAAFAIDAASMY